MTATGSAVMEPFDPNHGGTPDYLYIRVADHLAACIDAGLLVPGARLPCERELAIDYGVSIGTIRRATRELRDRGRVITLPAKGTYVAT